MKAIITILLSVVLFSSAHAEVNATASASQTVQLTLAPAIQILTNSVQVNASSQAFTVRSNKGFTITVNTVTPGQNVLLSLIDNKTQGNALNSNVALTATAQNLLTNCSRGNEQTFAVNYKSRHNAKVVYTATQP